MPLAIARAMIVWAALTSTATAADCDQFHQFPNQQGNGDTFSGVSPMPDVPPDGSVAQWTCFFPRNTPVANVEANLLRRDGSRAPYATYDVTFNRAYYEGQTIIKVSYQLIPGHKQRRNMKVEYKIDFEPPATAVDQAVFGQPAMACNQGTTYCIGIFPNGDFWLGNPRTDFKKQGNVYGNEADPRAKPRQFSIACSEAEYCVAFDNAGARFAGSIRPGGGDDFRKR